MKKRLKKNGIILVSGLIVSIVLTFFFGWSMQMLSNMLTYTGVLIMAYGAYDAANFKGFFSGLKKDINKRYSPDDKDKKERELNKHLIDGWLTLATGIILLGLSVLVVKI